MEWILVIYIIAQFLIGDIIVYFRLYLVHVASWKFNWQVCRSNYEKSCREEEVASSCSDNLGVPRLVRFLY